MPVDLVLYARDGGSTPNSNSIQLSITVQDINDNGPIFAEDVIQIMISEMAQPNTFVRNLNMDMEDIDSGSNAVPQFFIISGSTGIFALSSNGTLTLEQTLDRETVPVHQLEVLVQDTLRSTDFTDDTILNITVLDSNDNSPMFSQQQYTIPVS